MLKADHVNYCISTLSKDVVTMMRNHPIYLGGGYIRSRIVGEEPSDIDLFGRNKDEILFIADQFIKYREHRGIKCLVFKTSNAVTIKSPERLTVQFIHRWVGEPNEMMRSFDFTVCQAMIWFDPEYVGLNKKPISITRWNCHEDYYADLAAKTLVYTCPDRNEDAGGSMLRVIKFCRKGWKISPENLGLVMARLISGLEDDWRVKSEIGMAVLLTALLREVDPLEVGENEDTLDRA